MEQGDLQVGKKSLLMLVPIALSVALEKIAIGL